LIYQTQTQTQTQTPDGTSSNPGLRLLPLASGHPAGNDEVPRRVENRRWPRDPRLVPRRAVLSLAVAATLASVTPALAGGFGIPEIGVRRTGMAATVGRPDEPSAVFHNPAGLTLQHGFRFYASFGLSFVSTEFRLQQWDKSDEYLDEPVDADGYYPATRPEKAIGAIPMLVVTRQINDKIFTAASLYVANGTGAFFDKDAVTRYHLISGYIVSPLFQLSGAYRFSDKLSVGAGLGVLNIRIHGQRDFFPEYQGFSLRNMLGTRPELTLDGSDWQPSWNLGVLATPMPRLTLGATVIGKVHPTLDGPIALKEDEDSMDSPGYVFHGTAHTELVLPWTFLAGANFDVTPQLEVGTEFRYYLYRQYQNQHTQIDDIFLTDHLDSPKNYKDSWQTAGGLRVHDVKQAPGAELMLGFHYDRTPAPPETVTLDQPTFSHYGLHTGGRYAFGRYRVGASWVHYWYDIPTITDSITFPPSNIKGDGTNNIFSLSFEAVL
jgi:long-subunit fatty acid transport protein